MQTYSLQYQRISQSWQKFQLFVESVGNLVAYVHELFQHCNGHRMHNCFEVAGEIKKSIGFKSEGRAGQTVGLARFHCKAVACHWNTKISMTLKQALVTSYEYLLLFLCILCLTLWLPRWSLVTGALELLTIVKIEWKWTVRAFWI